MSDKVPQLIAYLRVLAMLRADGFHCNTEILDIMRQLDMELLKK